MRILRAWADRQLRGQIQRVEQYLESEPAVPSRERPVLVFNASTRIHTLSLNAAFSLLASWGLRAREVPVSYLVCRQGMQQCILGTDRQRLDKGPPCRPCLRFSELLFPERLTTWLRPVPEVYEAVRAEFADFSLGELKDWTYRDYPLGDLCLPGLRWVLRRHDLPDSEGVRGLYRQYLRSAAGLVERFEEIFETEQPRALLLFNGITYPEAVARAVAQRRGIRTVTHEVGLQPQSAYFSHEDATFREVPVPEEYQLSELQQGELDAYLQGRRQGRFSMAGVEFWPKMDELPDGVQEKLDQFDRMVVAFTNVIFDTSQVHANVLFEDMFDWLDWLAGKIRQHPDTLFVLRAHPDENRPGKEAAQSVAAWFRDSDLKEAENVLFFSPEEFVSSYQLIEAAHLVLVYNSSIGLEASIMGAPVLSAGRARYTQSDTVDFPDTRAAYERLLEEYLIRDEITPPARYAQNARRFLYRELHEASLDFSGYLRPYPSIPGMVLFERFEPDELRRDETLDVIRDGILGGEPFLKQTSSRAVETTV
ncbi:MAG: hypothetical protein ACLFWD_12000 [Anaerolineales bacterium]